MELKIQKRLSAAIMKCSEKRVTFDQDRLEEIKEAITRNDLRRLISDGAITRKPITSISKVRARKQQEQKRKGKRRGLGSRKGKKTARLPRKQSWMDKIRAQRKLLKELLSGSLIEIDTYRALYKKAKGGFFRSRRHIKLHIGEHKLLKESKK